ncbi:hypothetical protein O3P69_004250 [Scylla paramamosain]|uniref:Uncharacterized protein n=1 Tax=Scylla paramamosain TaxID=85552 RepID=A0AAW0UFV4_SCYPA
MAEDSLGPFIEHQAVTAKTETIPMLPLCRATPHHQLASQPASVLSVIQPCLRVLITCNRTLYTSSLQYWLEKIMSHPLCKLHMLTAPCQHLHYTPDCSLWVSCGASWPAHFTHSVSAWLPLSATQWEGGVAPATGCQVPLPDVKTIHMSYKGE